MSLAEASFLNTLTGRNIQPRHVNQVISGYRQGQNLIQAADNVLSFNTPNMPSFRGLANLRGRRS